ncbi:MAG TPA: hypothetical protein VFQ13_25075 [Anaerolineales bacterium]|nr:hypothetical protein [Anaerolineales bacterium]
MRAFWILLIILLAFALAGCGTSQPEGDFAPSDPLPPPSEEVLSTPLSDLPNQGETAEMTPTISTDASLQNLIKKAKEDLAQRLNLVLTQIDVLEAKAVVWPDASLGCPQPGMRYKQVPEDGALIVLKANGITYEYHSGGHRELFLCQKTSKEPTLPPIDLLNLTPSSPDSSGPDAPTPDNSIPPGEDK